MVFSRSAKTPRGLSPRGRGNQPGRHGERTGQRSIPAWAGEPLEALAIPCPSTVYPRGGGGTQSDWVRQKECTVYPRVGGGTRIRWPVDRNLKGLSPRGRGNHVTAVLAPTLRRSIPAGAGEPVSAPPADPEGRVYPRGGGGTPSNSTAPVLIPGLSPRGRGNQELEAHDLPALRSIPAGAGEPVYTLFIGLLFQVYPRGGGGTASYLATMPDS